MPPWIVRQWLEMNDVSASWKVLFYRLLSSVFGKSGTTVVVRYKGSYKFV